MEREEHVENILRHIEKMRFQKVPGAHMYQHLEWSASASSHLPTFAGTSLVGWLCSCSETVPSHEITTMGLCSAHAFASQSWVSLRWENTVTIVMVKDTVPNSLSQLAITIGYFVKTAAVNICLTMGIKVQCFFIYKSNITDSRDCQEAIYALGSACVIWSISEISKILI